MEDVQCMQAVRAADEERRLEWAAREAAGRVLFLVVLVSSQPVGSPALD